MAALPKAFWQQAQETLLRVLTPLLNSAASDGAGSALGDLADSVGVAVDASAVNTAVQKWAKRHAAELAKGITATTQQRVQDALADWIGSGNPLSDLIAQLEPHFGLSRAQLVASTEVTRAFAVGNQAAWQESGMVDGMTWMTAQDERVCEICGPLAGEKLDLDSNDIPPAHPRCRCWVQPIVSLP